MSNEQHEAPIAYEQAEQKESQAKDKAEEVQKNEGKIQQEGMVENEQKQDDNKMTEIIREKGTEQIKGADQAKERKSSDKLPVIINPVYYYVSIALPRRAIKSFNGEFSILKQQHVYKNFRENLLDKFNKLSHQKVQVSFDLIGSTNIKGHIFYNVKVRDQKGERQISRRYTEYLLWRNKLLQLWPCVILAALPSKTIIGVSEDDLVRSRSKYIIRFLKSISKYEGLLECEQVQIFLQEGEDKNWQFFFEQRESPKYLQLLQKYKKYFTEEYVFSQREQFMYRKEQMPLILEQYQNYFSSKKIDLMDYCISLRRMAESKLNYFKAVNKLNSLLLPDYQDTLYRWIYAEPLPDHSKQSAEKGEEESNKDKQQELFGLYSSQAYKAKLQDTILQVQNFNGSTWTIYDPIKFQLKEIDSVMGAIEQAKILQREIEYLERTMNINKEQIESLNNNKTTLKTFFMDGNVDDKKTKLTNDNHIIGQQLQKYTELYYILMVLLQKQLEEYHKIRANFYKNSVGKAFLNELEVVKSTMDFHIYEQQLFGKERLQRVNLLRQQEQQKQKLQKNTNEQEIKQ